MSLDSMFREIGGYFFSIGLSNKYKNTKLFIERELKGEQKKEFKEGLHKISKEDSLVKSTICDALDIISIGIAYTSGKPEALAFLAIPESLRVGVHYLSNTALNSLKEGKLQEISGDYRSFDKYLF